MYIHQQVYDETFYRRLTAFQAEFPVLISSNTYLMWKSHAGIYEFIRRLSRWVKGFFWHSMFLYSASLLSVHIAILSLSLLKPKTLLGRFSGSSLLLKRDKMTWDISVESQAFVLMLRFQGAISCLYRISFERPIFEKSRRTITNNRY